MDGAFDRFLALVIIGILFWMIYESRRGNNLLERFTSGNRNIGNNNIGGNQFGIRKH